MKAIQKINNNVALCLDDKGRRIIAFGKGIGFGAMPRELREREIEQTFYKVDDSYIELLRKISPEILSLCIDAVNEARNKFALDYDRDVALFLADHISFAIERAEKGIEVKMPLEYEVASAYPREMRLSVRVLRRLREQICPTLPDSEAVGIALCFANAHTRAEAEAALGGDISFENTLRKMTRRIEEICGCTIDRQSFHYARFASHTYFLYQRLREGRAIDSQNVQLYREAMLQFPHVSDCTEQIADWLSSVFHAPLGDEEKLYLMLHINRVCTKIGREISAAD